MKDNSKTATDREGQEFPPLVLPEHPRCGRPTKTGKPCQIRLTTGAPACHLHLTDAERAEADTPEGQEKAARIRAEFAALKQQAIHERAEQWHVRYRERRERYRAERDAELWQAAQQVRIHGEAYATAAEFAARENVTLDEAASILIEWGTRPYPPQVCPDCHGVSLMFDGRCISCGYRKPATRLVAAGAAADEDS